MIARNDGSFDILSKTKKPPVSEWRIIIILDLAGYPKRRVCLFFAP
jgi:hypothetical protein